MPEAVPPGTVTVSVDEQPGVQEAGLRLAVGPAGLTVTVRLTGELKPEMLDTVMVEVAESPGAMCRNVGLAETLKSGGVTVTETVAE